MRVSDVCRNYFSGFQEISNCRKNSAKTNTLALLKVLSYFTLVIPVAFAAVYGANSLYERVSKKQNLSSQEQSVANKGQEIILKKPAASPPPVASSPTSPPQTLKSDLPSFEDELRGLNEEVYSKARDAVVSKMEKADGKAVAVNLNEVSFNDQKLALDALLARGVIDSWARGRGFHYMIKADENDREEDSIQGSWRTLEHLTKEIDFHKNHPISIPAEFSKEERELIKEVYRRVPNLPRGAARELGSSSLELHKINRVMDLLVECGAIAAWGLGRGNTIIIKMEKSDQTEVAVNSWRDKTTIQREKAAVYAKQEDRIKTG